MKNIELYNDHFQNYKSYAIPKAQLIIADIPYNIGKDAYGSNPSWYVDGDNKNGESDKAGFCTGVLSLGRFSDQSSGSPIGAITGSLTIAKMLKNG